MRKPAEIAPWLSQRELKAWLRASPDKAAYQRRLAVWITREERLPAHRVATLLGVSIQAVWKWVGEYNKRGPESLERRGRGGRRVSLMSEDQEQQFLSKHLIDFKRRRIASEKHLHQALTQILGRGISESYIRRLLIRYSIRDLLFLCADK